MNEEAKERALMQLEMFQDLQQDNCNLRFLIIDLKKKTKKAVNDLMNVCRDLAKQIQDLENQIQEIKGKDLN